MKQAHGKQFGRHSTHIDAAAPLVKALAGLADVKIIIGIIKQTKGAAAPIRLKITETQSGFQVKVRGPKSVQTFLIATSDKAAIRKRIDEAYR